ncbi:MAG: hypothetical protein H6R26_1041, partial [Proteobacteria bacterium]|nr:hypothetical protein [Pseudomonadota bacterium]
VPEPWFQEADPPYALVALPEPPPQAADPPRAVVALPPCPRSHDAEPP